MSDANVESTLNSAPDTANAKMSANRPNSKKQQQLKGGSSGGGIGTLDQNLQEYSKNAGTQP